MNRPESKPPFFSVIVPVHNAAAWVDKTIQSILAQSLQDFEVILVDDGSTDDSLARLHNWAALDKRIRVVQQPNLGAAQARNSAIKRCVGNWIAQCDADDLWDPEKLVKQKKFIDEWDAAKAGCDLVALGTFGYYVNVKGKSVGIMDVGCTSVLDYRKKLERGKIHFLLSSSVVFLRSAVLEGGLYDSSYQPSEDVELWCRLAERGAVLSLPDRLVRYRIHPESAISGSFMRSKTNALRIEQNIIRRREGKSLLSLADVEKLIKDSPHSYHKLVREWRAQYWYRRGACQLVNGRAVRGLIGLVTGLCVSPEFVIKRARAQMKSPFNKPIRKRSLLA